MAKKAKIRRFRGFDSAVAAVKATFKAGDGITVQLLRQRCPEVFAGRPEGNTHGFIARAKGDPRLAEIFAPPPPSSQPKVMDPLAGLQMRPIEVPKSVAPALCSPVVQSTVVLAVYAVAGCVVDRLVSGDYVADVAVRMCEEQGEDASPADVWLLLELLAESWLVRRPRFGHHRFAITATQLQIVKRGLLAVIPWEELLKKYRREPRRKRQIESRFCRWCGEPGHGLRSCPEEPDHWNTFTGPALFDPSKGESLMEELDGGDGIIRLDPSWR